MICPFVDNELTRSSLRGIKQIFIFVQPIDFELEQLGLTEDQILTAVQLKLRMAGIIPLSEEEARKTPDCLVLMIFLAGSEPDGENIFPYAVSLGVSQSIFLTRDESIKSVGLTWGCGPITGVMETGQGEQFRNRIKDLVDSFNYAWLSANPQRRT
jgi:hypothetical protein